MSQENVETVEAGLRAFNERDVEKFAELVTGDFEWIPAVSSAVDTDVYVGRAGINRYFSESGDIWRQLSVLHDELRDLNDSVLMLGRAVGRGLGSGVEVETQLAFIAAFRGGRMSKVSTYLRHDEALKAVGLTG
ncbi:MAG TPA: nuclear transport factor 2 family protein [Solirubrobacteraceae bacterium]|jgi:ketosteroid isomerase-like protein|nr:nuclear transport factor 2 family protein [Solirubrobacteraceae bacterium]